MTIENVAKLFIMCRGRDGPNRMADIIALTELLQLVKTTAEEQLLERLKEAVINQPINLFDKVKIDDLQQRR